MKISKYKELLRFTDNEHFKRQFFLTKEIINESLVTNVFFVPKRGDDWLYVVKEDAKLDYPGGELKEGESVIFGLERMLSHELGINIKSMSKLGHWILEDKYETPLREHFPHPISAAIVFTGEVMVSDLKSNSTLKVSSIKELLKLLKAQKRHLQADIYQACFDYLKDSGDE